MRRQADLVMLSATVPTARATAPTATAPRESGHDPARRAPQGQPKAMTRHLPEDTFLANPDVQELLPWVGARFDRTSRWTHT